MHSELVSVQLVGRRELLVQNGISRDNRVWVEHKKLVRWQLPSILTMCQMDNIFPFPLFTTGICLLEGQSWDGAVAPNQLGEEENFEASVALVLSRKCNPIGAVRVSR